MCNEVETVSVLSYWISVVKWFAMAKEMLCNKQTHNQILYV